MYHYPRIRIVKRLIALTLFAALLLLLPCGCEEFAYTYHYHGLLRNVDQSPTESVKVAMLTDRSFVFYWDGHPIDSRDWDHVTSKSNGEFSGEAFGGTYVSWLNMPGPPSPETKSVCLWFYRSGRWSPIVISLNKAQQAQTSHGGRYLELGIVKIPPPAVHSTTRSSAEKCS